MIGVGCDACGHHRVWLCCLSAALRVACVVSFSETSVESPMKFTYTYTNEVYLPTTYLYRSREYQSSRKGCFILLIRFITC